MSRYQAVIAGAVLALSAAAGAAAYAQAAPNPEPQPRLERGERHEHNARDFHRAVERPDQAEHLRAILQLKPAQEPALTAYIAATQRKFDRERMSKMRGEGRPKTTPEKLARMEARMSEHEAALKTQIAATKRFYDQLDPAQRRAFDELPLAIGGPPMPMMGGMNVMYHRMPPPPPIPPVPPTPPRS